MFKIYKCFVLFYERESHLMYRLPGTHPIQIYYNSSFIYAYSIYAGISRNLTPAQNKGLLYNDRQHTHTHARARARTHTQTFLHNRVEESVLNPLILTQEEEISTMPYLRPSANNNNERSDITGRHIVINKLQGVLLYSVSVSQLNIRTRWAYRTAFD
jgi:hypothetical protein